jgi:hypothetical protein
MHADRASDPSIVRHKSGDRSKARVVKQAGHVWGLDALAEKLTFFQQHPIFVPLRMNANKSVLSSELEGRPVRLSKVFSFFIGAKNSSRSLL